MLLRFFYRNSKVFKDKGVAFVRLAVEHGNSPAAHRGVIGLKVLVLVYVNIELIKEVIYPHIAVRLEMRIVNADKLVLNFI